MKCEKGRFQIKGFEYYYVVVSLPKTTLLVVGNDVGYFMCGALDVEVFNQEHLKSRKVVCGRALGVKTVNELLNAPLSDISFEAEKLGVFNGMLVKDALLVIS